MFKAATFAALTLLATLTAVQAAIKSAVPRFPPVGAQLQTSSPPKAKMPSRRTFGPVDAAFGIEQMQFD